MEAGSNVFSKPFNAQELRVRLFHRPAGSYLGSVISRRNRIPRNEGLPSHGWVVETIPTVCQTVSQPPNSLKKGMRHEQLFRGNTARW